MEPPGQGRVRAGTSGPARRSGCAAPPGHGGDREQLHLSGRALELGHGQVGIPQRSQRNGLGIDRVRLAGLPRAARSRRHQPSRHPDHAVAGDEQVRFQPAGQMAAVLQREHHLIELRRPSHQLQMPVAVGTHRLGRPASGPTSSTATTVWVRLWESVPIMTMPRSSSLPWNWWIQTDTRRARLNRARRQAPIKPQAGRPGHPARPHIEDQPTQRGTEERSEPRRALSGWH